MSLHNVGAIILAAGRAQRMGGGKLLRSIHDKPMVAHVIDAARTAGIADVRLVIPPNAEALVALGEAAGVNPVIAADAARGMAHSLAAGLRSVPPEWRGAFILLGDMPFVDPALLQQMAARFTEEAIVVPSYQGQRGNPILWSRAHFAALAALSGDVGGRALLAAHAADIVDLPWTDASILTDIDTPEDLAAHTGGHGVPDR